MKKPAIRRRARQVSGRITLEQVAKLAGVSVSTASRSLSAPDLVADETVAQVRDAVSQTGYVPNLLAGGLASNRSRLVAAIVPTVTAPIFGSCIRTFTEELGRAGYQVLLGQSGYGESREDAVLSALLSRRPDGIILTGIVHSPEGRRQLIAAGTPVVETWDLTPTPIDMLVGFSHERIGEAAADFLHRRGVRRPGVISADDPRARLRTNGFLTRAMALGWPKIPVHVVHAPAVFNDGRRGLAALLERQPEVDALFCSSDYVAFGAVTEARKRGLPVPQRLAIVGFGDQDFAGYTEPSLTTVQIDGSAIGRQAAQFILDKIAGKPIPARVVDVGFSIIARESA